MDKSLGESVENGYYTEVVGDAFIPAVVAGRGFGGRVTGSSPTQRVSGP
jgi:hypothetical protein